jgi:pyrroline-5-carboxylate reductase
MLPERWRRVGFIGAGSMAEAMVAGLLAAGVTFAPSIVVTNRSRQDRLDAMALRWGVRTTRSKAEVCATADVVVLATKPADIPTVLEQLRGLVTSRHLVVSVAAGIPCAVLQRGLGEGIPVVRAMPNTSCHVKESATAIALGRWAGEEHEGVARTIFGAVGQVVTVPEEWLDAVTGLSGSGPAYVYLLMEALTEAGVEVGLSPEVSRLLTRQTVLGAARMVLETGEDPALLRRKVTSPNGTTMAALRVLEEMGFVSALREAVRRATARSREMGQEFFPAAERRGVLESAGT